jgi:hypothetical protein
MFPDLEGISREQDYLIFDSNRGHFENSVEDQNLKIEIRRIGYTQLP